LKYRERVLERYDFPLAQEVNILHPERALLRFGTFTINFGALCYLARSADSRRMGHGRHGSRPVDTCSFSSARAGMIRKVISHLSDEVTHHGIRMSTIYVYAGTFSTFLDWADRNGHSAVLNEVNAAYCAFRAYNGHLWDRVRGSSISVNTATKCQNCVLRIVSEVMGIDNLQSGINLIRGNFQASEPATPPCERAQAKSLSLCHSLFNGFADLVLNGKQYPYRLQMPKYLGLDRDFLWVFPSIRWCMPAHIVAKRTELGNPYWANDYENGRVANADEIAPHYSVNSESATDARKISVAQSGVSKAEASIEAANNDPMHFHRRNVAMLAHNAFVLLFIANTGMNMAQVRELRWSGEYKVGAERQGFRAVKWRAGGSTISVEIQLVFLPSFRRYLELRAYLLQGASSEHLFFSIGRNCAESPKAINERLIVGLFKTLKMLDESITVVLPRQWRAAKSDWFLRTTDPAITSEALQNSEATVLKHYSTGSPMRALEEMGKFFAQVSEAALKKTVVSNGSGQETATEGPVGACVAFGIPNGYTTNVPVTPDCKRPEGCFFCEHYRVHADAEDTRKLLSCRYCILHVSQSEAAQDFFRPILYRIQTLLDEIGSRKGNEGLVERVQREVETNGELTPYWAQKLAFLMELGLT
jgi:hypothetical protein